MTAVHCTGCGEPIEGELPGTVWIHGALGLVAVKTHRVVACADLAVQAHPEQPAKRVREPQTKAQKKAAEKVKT